VHVDQRPAQTPARASFVCPVAGTVRFTDTYGAPRSGGRRHQGVDLFAKKGTALLAVTDAVVVRVHPRPYGRGGISITIRARDGTTFYYAHARDLVVTRKGTRVRRGQVLGHLGNTGNAARTAPHLHFEVRPGPRGTRTVNPTPYAAARCAASRQAGRRTRR